MQEVLKQIVGVICGVIIGALGYFVVQKIRHPMGTVKVEKFVPLEDELDF